jgi:DNA replication protein DnaC
MSMYRCQLCKDEGGQFVKAPVVQTVHGSPVEVIMDHWKVCECIERLKVERIMRSSQITSQFRKMTFSSFNADDLPPSISLAHKKATIYYKKFADIRKTPNNGIILMGRPGCGKTHLLMAITNGLMDQGQEVLYVPWVETMEMVKDDMSKEDVNNKRFEKMQTVDLLYIDDLFKPPTKPSDYEVKKLFQIINYRYQERKPIMISTERTRDFLLDLDEGLGSRINEMCKEFRVEIQGGRELNYRLREEA